MLPKNLRACANPHIVPDNRGNSFIPPNPDRNLLVNPYVVTNNAAMVKHDAEPIMAKVYILSSDLRLIWNEAAKPKPQELLNHERQNRDLSSGKEYSPICICNKEDSIW